MRCASCDIAATGNLQALDYSGSGLPRAGAMGCRNLQREAESTSDIAAGGTEPVAGQRLGQNPWAGRLAGLLKPATGEACSAQVPEVH